MNTLQLQSRRWTRQARKAGLIHDEPLRYTVQEQENMKLQAAWLMRCFKPRTPFHVLEEAPSRLNFGLEEFIAFAISDVRRHGICSEQFQDAAATLRILFNHAKLVRK